MTSRDLAFVSFTQNHEDVVLFRALKDVAAGFYIDVGAHDPDIESVTRAFYERGWRGINLEPSALWYERLTVVRPRDINLNLAAWNAPGELSFHDIEGTGLSTSDSEAAQRHRSGGRFPAHDIQVGADTLDNLCRLHGVADIHFLKVDVEGTEREVLEGMDFQAVRPWIVLVEALDPISLAPTHDKWEDLLLKAGYEFALFDGLNRFYYDRNRPDIGRRLQAPASIVDKYVAARDEFSDPVFSPGFGINLIGNLSGGVGLGVITRGIAALLKARRVPFSIFDVPHAWGNPQISPAFADHLVTQPDALRHPVNLYVLPTVFFETFFQSNPAFQAQKRFHIANLWWEASRLPPRWVDMLSRFDGILALSEFIADICRNGLPMTPTLCGEAPLALPANIRADRKEFGLPDDAVVFVASLDPNSDPERKNPEALVTAFRNAFPGADDGVRLVIRLNNAKTDFGQHTVRRLLQLADGDGRIGLLLEPMGYDQILSLYACADIYLSFHRGEGLGLGMLESMSLGKAVIATGWSGNLAFMNHSNSALLRYRLVQVAGNYSFFHPEVIGRDARWADPVLEDAVAWMRLLRSDARLRHAMGAKAKVAAGEYQSKAGKALWLTELDDLWQAQKHLPQVVEKLSYSADPTSCAH